MDEEEKVAFTVRIPASVARQIDGRAKILKRSRNFIVSDLIMKAIDEGVRSDLETLRTTSDRIASRP